MHLISELSDHLEILPKTVKEEEMINKRDMSVLESILFLRAIEQYAGKRKASEILGTSVDTINKYIESLEEYFGVKLISTNGRGSNLTHTGRHIVEKSTKIKEALDEIYNIRLANQEIKGEVKVFMALGYASYMVPQDLSSFFDAFPELVINSVTATDISSLDINNTDIVITYEELNNYDTVLLTERTVHCGFFASSHYLAHKGYPVDIDDLVKNHRLITKHDSLLKKVLGDEKFKKSHICFISNNTLALINALENSTGIGIMPLSFAMQGLVCLDNIICDCPITYRLYANRHTKDIPRVRTLINFYKNIMDKLGNPVPVPSQKGEPLPIVKDHMKNTDNTDCASDS